MEKRLEQYLYKKYPELFKNENKSMKESSMVWGCSCGDGWFFLLDNLCSAITRHIERHNNQVDYYDSKNMDRPKWAKEKIPQVYFDQVKEKFGSLRIYYTGGDEKIQNMIGFAEFLSESICEICGKFDFSIGRTAKGWIRNTCKECANIDERERGWKPISSELEEVWKSAMEDKEKWERNETCL